MTQPGRRRSRCPPTVLLIEAQLSRRTMLEMVLSSEGMWVVSAVSLESALLQLRVLRPDLIILGTNGHPCAADAPEQIAAACEAPLIALGNGADAPFGMDAAGGAGRALDTQRLIAQIAELLDLRGKPPYVPGVGPALVNQKD